MSTLRHVSSVAAVAAFAFLAVASGGKSSKDSPSSTTTTTGAQTPDDPNKPMPLNGKVKFKNSALPDLELTMDAPSTAQSEEKFTNTVVTAGNRFQIMISQGNENLADMKKSQAGGEAFMKVSKYDIDTADTLLFEGELFGTKGYHFVYNVKAGPTSFLKCTDWQKLDAVYTKADAEQMLAACKTLKDANAKAPVAAAAKPAAKGKAAPAKKK